MHWMFFQNWPIDASTTTNNNDKGVRMKKILVQLAVLLTASVSLADGFICESEDAGLRVQVYNQVQPEMGVRNAAVMILSDMTVAGGRKTIARFQTATGTLWNEAALYTANVDLRFNDSGRKGELVVGTKLGHVDQFELGVDFSYAHPVADGEILNGILTVLKRGGEAIELDMVCARYLKN